LASVHFLSPACQLRTTVTSGLADRSLESTRKRWPSAAGWYFQRPAAVAAPRSMSNNAYGVPASNVLLIFSSTAISLESAEM
jgi:hypothetical protein